MTDRGYEQFIHGKTHLAGEHGFPATWLPEALFPFQRAIVEWSCRKGRSAIFADCGLGKTLMQLVWAENVRRATGMPVLVATPLAVAQQTVAEADRFGIEAAVSRDGSVPAGITVTNYERLEHFDRDDFGGVVCDESSAIKAFDGKRRAIVTEFMRKSRYRLLCTATAAPNDYTELGTSSEALGHMGHMDMLARFFTNDQNTSDPRRQWVGGGKWRLKGHAHDAFWKWVCSWAISLRRPSDLGFSDEGFNLPNLVEREHVVEARTRPEGCLFELAAQNMREERAESRRTIGERCERVADLLNHSDPAVAWCHLNAEAKLLTELVPGATQVSGSDPVEEKESRLMAFGSGEIRTLVIKPKIGAWGLNWQHCAHMTYFPSHSFEQYYQAVRRCWRFGQSRPVVVDIVTTEGGFKAKENLRLKSEACDEMFSRIVRHMHEAEGVPMTGAETTTMEIPTWL